MRPLLLLLCLTRTALAADLDGDGYDSGVDCDDTSATTYPGADEICDEVDQDCDMLIDEPELGEDSGCVAMFRDQDSDGYGDLEEEVCLCLSGDDTASVNPDDGFTYVTFGGDCNDSHSTLKPLSCTDGYDNDGDGSIDGDDLDCASGYDEYGAELEVKREHLDGHDNDCDGLIPAVELDCDDDGSLPILPLESGGIDAAEYPEYAPYDDYREAWEDAGFLTALDLGLSACGEGDVIEVSGCLGEDSVTLECDALSLKSDDDGNQRVLGSGLWMVRYADSDSGFGARYDGGYRSYPDGRPTDSGGDCDDHCDLRYSGGEEVCDGIDNTCSDVDPGTDDDGIPDSMDESVSIGGSIPLAESDVDGDGALDCESFTASDAEGWSEGSCTAVEDEWLSDADDTDPAVISEDDLSEAEDGTSGDDDKASCATAPGAGGLVVMLSMLLGIRRRDR